MKMKATVTSVDMFMGNPFDPKRFDQATGQELTDDFYRVVAVGEDLGHERYSFKIPGSENPPEVGQEISVTVG